MERVVSGVPATDLYSPRQRAEVCPGAASYDPACDSLQETLGKVWTDRRSFKSPLLGGARSARILTQAPNPNRRGVSKARAHLCAD